MIAARTFGNPATVVAQQCRREASTVQEQDDLIACLQVLAHAIDKGRRESCL
jgi:hypothetical protein